MANFYVARFGRQEGAYTSFLPRRSNIFHSEAGPQEELPDLRRERTRVVQDPCPGGPERKFSQPKPVLTIDCRCEKRRPSPLAPESVKGCVHL